MAIGKPSSKETIVKPGHKIKAKGTYNVDDLYKELYKWFDHYGFKWYEIQYRKLDMGGGKYRLELLWQADKTLDEYSNFIIDLHLAADLENVEVTSETGQKGKKQKGTLEFRAGAEIKKNTQAFEKSSIGQLMGGAVGKFNAKLYDVLNRTRLEQQKTDCYVEIHKLFNEIQAFMMIYK
jgi:hypothetical protein